MLNLKNLLKPIKIKKIELHLSAVLLLVVALRLRFLNQLAISYVITALHEIAHIFVAHRLGVKIRGVEVLPFGITMRLEDSGIKKPKDEIRVSLAGPLCNLVVAYLTYGFYGGQSRDFIICTSLAIGLLKSDTAVGITDKIQSSISYTVDYEETVREILSAINNITRGNENVEAEKPVETN